MMQRYKEFYTCKSCGNVFYDICLSCKQVFLGDRIMCPSCRSIEKREKKKYLVCPECGVGIVEEAKVKDLDVSEHRHCINCGYKIEDYLKGTQNEKIRIVGSQRESLERLLYIQHTVSQALLECMKKGKFKMVMEYNPESPKIVFEVYKSNCAEQPDNRMEF